MNYQSKLAYLNTHGDLMNAEQAAYKAWLDASQRYPQSDPAVRELWSKWEAASKAVEKHTQEMQE